TNDTFLIYDIKKDEIVINVENKYFEKILENKIHLLNVGNLKYNIQKKKGKIQIKIFPSFLCKKITLKIKLNKKEGVFTLKNGKENFYSKQRNIDFYPGEYIVKKDKKRPVIKRYNGDIYVKDNSKINYNKCYAKVNGQILHIEKDFNINFEGKLEIYRKFKKNKKITFYLYDIFDNKRKFKVRFYMLSFRTNPFSKP
ncbi:hypothetical protein J7L48_08780, partial [bacterium]|nr:hypothetical protein [bacterium]